MALVLIVSIEAQLLELLATGRLQQPHTRKALPGQSSTPELLSCRKIAMPEGYLWTENIKQNKKSLNGQGSLFHLNFNRKKKNKRQQLLKGPFVRLRGLSSLQSIINFAISGNFYGLWTTWPWMQRYLRCLNMTSCSATPASGICFTTIQGPSHAWLWLYVSGSLLAHEFSSCQWRDPSACSVCQPGWLALQTPFIQLRTNITPPLCRLTGGTGVCAFKAVHPLSEIETLFPVLYKSNWFHCNIVYCVFSRMSEIPGNDFSLSASRPYLEA